MDDDVDEDLVELIAAKVRKARRAEGRPDLPWSSVQAGAHQAAARAPGLGITKLVALASDLAEAAQDSIGDRRAAMAARFVEALERHGGPALKPWRRDQTVRVYFPEQLGHVFFSEGAVHTMDRGKATLLPSDLPMSWRKAFRAAMAELVSGST